MRSKKRLRGGYSEPGQNEVTLTIVSQTPPEVKSSQHFPGVVSLLVQAHDRGEAHVTVAMARLLIRLLAGRGGGHE